jgi:hypothetical protein
MKYIKSFKENINENINNNFYKWFNINYRRKQ